jgi:nicotinamide mononucleotide (NMN) deamidase PncC
VGLVFISVATRRQCAAREFRFSGNRLEVKRKACDAGLEMLARCVAESGGTAEV